MRIRRARDARRGLVLDLHLVEEDVAVLRQLDLPRPADQHLQRALRACIKAKGGCARASGCVCV